MCLKASSKMVGCLTAIIMFALHVFDTWFFAGIAHGNGSYVFACGDMWQGEWKDGLPWKVGSLTCPLSASSQSQPAIWAAVGARALRADASTQPLVPNFIFQQTFAAASAATLRGINFPLKTPALPLSGDSSMMAVEKQRSAFASRPERRDVAALLIAGASQASLIDSSVMPSRNSSRVQQRRQHMLDSDSNIEVKVPLQPTSSNPQPNAHFKGKSEQRFRMLAAASGIRSNQDAASFVSISERFQDALVAADTAQARLRASDDDLDAKPPATAAAKLAPAKTCKKLQLRDATEAWV